MALTTTEEAQLRQLIAQQAAILSLASSESTIISKLGASKVTISDLPGAGSIADSDLFLIRQGTTEKNVTGAVVKALASSSVGGATETTAGIVELATAAETQAGTDNSRAIHAAGLASLTATETRAGLLEIATDSEARAFTANKAIDGAKLASALTGTNQSLSANGYQKLPGGLIIQWGSIATPSAGSGSVTSSVTFPIAFPTAVASITNSQNTSISASYNDVVTINTVSTSGFIVRVIDAEGGGIGGGDINWIAIGY